MANIPSARQAQILQWLQDSHMLTIDDLVDRLSVSVMTVHRDLDALEGSGLVEKVHGGVTLPRLREPHIAVASVCRWCDMPVPSRTTFAIQLENGQQFQACCPHCGLMALNETRAVISALARDFIYGRMVNVWQAIYLVEPEITLCCVPPVLCFASREDAARFQRGFEGEVMTFEEAQAYLIRHHRKIQG